MTTHNPTRFQPVVIALPIHDRRRSYRFYAEGLGLQAVGELAEDGIPEPLQLQLNDGVRLMLPPREGFGWVVGGRQVATAGTVECLLSISAATPAGVDAILAQARQAGAEIVSEPEQLPWGYTGTFADPDGHLWTVLADGGAW
jgi:predicted lactoylglutathione lyase